MDMLLRVFHDIFIYLRQGRSETLMYRPHHYGDRLSQQKNDGKTLNIRTKQALPSSSCEAKLEGVLLKGSQYFASNQ